MNNIKNIDDKNKMYQDNDITLKYEIIKKILNILNREVPPAANTKLQIIYEDRLSYKVDQLIINYPNLSKHIQCGKLQNI